MAQPSIDCTVTGFAYRSDPRTLTEQLAAIAELGAIAPEALLMSEIRMLCSAYLSGGRPAAANAAGETEHRLIA